MAQIIPVDIDYKLHNSELVVEGEIVSQNCFVHEDGYIYTANYLKPLKVLMGSLPKNPIKIVTYGGTLDGRTESWTHLLKLNKGDHGIFFMAKNPILNDHYSVASSSQGFLRFSQSRDGIKVSDPVHSYENLQLDIYNKISSYANQKIEIINDNALIKSSDENCLLTEFELLNNNDEESISANIGINLSLTENPKYLNSSNITMEYDTLIFGKNIISSGILSAEIGSQLPPEVYSITAIDLSSNIFQITVESNGNPLLLLDNNKKQAVVLSIDPFQPEGILNFNDESIKVSTTVSSIDNNRPERISCYDIETGIQRNCILITKLEILNEDLEPLPEELFVAAGIKNDPSLTSISSIIKITAIDGGFGVPDLPLPKPVDGNVMFTDVETLNMFATPIKDYISWTDNEIIVRVPSRSNTTPINSFFDDNVAATGKVAVEVTDCEGTFCSDSKDLIVGFAMANRGYEEIYRDVDNCGITISEITGTGDRRMNLVDIKNGGTEVFIVDEIAPGNNSLNEKYHLRIRSALDTWRCTYGITIAEVDVLNSIATSIISTEPLDCTVSSTTFARNAQTGDDFCFLPDTDGYIEKFSMRINSSIIAGTCNGYSFYVESAIPSTPAEKSVDLETTILHELGHGFGLRHTRNIIDVMGTPYDIQGDYKRDFSPFDALGAFYIDKLKLIGACDKEAMEHNICEPLHTNDFENLTSINVYPSPAKDFFVIENKENVFIDRVCIRDINGRILMSEVSINFNQHVVKIDIPDEIISGLYLISGYEENGNLLFNEKLVIAK